MPKQKTHKGAAKRLKPTGSGRLKTKQTGRRHLLASVSTSRKRHKRGTTDIDSSDLPRARAMLGVTAAKVKRPNDNQVKAEEK